MADLTTGTAFVGGTTIVASAMNTRFTNIETWAKGTPDLSTSGSMTTIKGTLNVDEAVTFDSSLTMTGALTVGVDGTGHDVKFWGDTATRYMEWDQSADKLTVNKGDVLFAATDSGEKVHWNGTSSDPVLIVHGSSGEDVLTVTQGRTKLSQRVYCLSTDEADLDAVSGALVVGGDGTGQHLAFDTNEIQSKTNGTTAGELRLNPHGGDIRINPQTTDAKIGFGDDEAGGVTDSYIRWDGGNDAFVFVADGAAVVAMYETTGTQLGVISTDSGDDLVLSSAGYIRKKSSALKYKNVADVSMSDYLTASMVDSLEPKMFSYKSDESNHPMIGFIADECDAVSPFLAYHDSDGEVSSTDKDALIALLAIGLKDARTRIAALEA